MGLCSSCEEDESEDESKDESEDESVYEEGEDDEDSDDVDEGVARAQPNHFSQRRTDEVAMSSLQDTTSGELKTG